MWNEFTNALAWFKSAPAEWIKSGKQSLEAAAEWIWNVLQGDFAEEQSTAQVITGTVISMIPFVDQICDVRDVVANARKINQDSNDKWAWVALVLTLIGLFPTLGSLLKGCLKILFAYGRKALFKAGKEALDADLWKATAPYIEHGIRKLNDFMARPDVRKTLNALKIDQPYKYLAEQIRKISAQLQLGKLLSAFDEALDALKSFADMVQKWGTASMQTRMGQLVQTVVNVRNKANRSLALALKPAQDWLNRLAQRLDVEHRLNYRTQTNAVNPHNFGRCSLDAEIEAIKEAKPKWLKVRKGPLHRELRRPPTVPHTHSDISDMAPKPLRGAYSTFADIRPDTIAPGTTLYRVLDPASNDNSICWMTKAEFDQLLSKAEWRERFAVWRNWNHNGEFVTYTVPPGPGLPVWRGTTASQELKDGLGNAVKADKAGNSYWLDGGAEQLVIDPKHLEQGGLGKRQFTGWGYDEMDIQTNLVGVPVLQANWRN
jgi:hypothetical protein